MVKGPLSRDAQYPPGGSAWDESFAALGLDWSMEFGNQAVKEGQRGRGLLVDPGDAWSHPPTSPSTSPSSPCSTRDGVVEASSISTEIISSSCTLPPVFSMDVPSPLTLPPSTDIPVKMEPSSDHPAEQPKELDRRCWDKCVMEIHEQIARLEMLMPPVRDWQTGEGVTSLIVRLQSLGRWMGHSQPASSTSAPPPPKPQPSAPSAPCAPLPPPPPPSRTVRSTSASAVVSSSVFMGPSPRHATRSSTRNSAAAAAAAAAAATNDSSSSPSTSSSCKQPTIPVPRLSRSLSASSLAVEERSPSTAPEGTQREERKRAVRSTRSQYLSEGNLRQMSSRQAAVMAAVAADDEGSKRRRTATFADLRKTCEKQLLWTIVKMLKDDIPGGFPFVNKDKTRLEDLRSVLACFNGPWGPMVAPHICQDKRAWKLKLALSSYARKLMDFLLHNKSVCGEYREIIATMGYVSIGGENADQLRLLLSRSHWAVRLRQSFECHLDASIGTTLRLRCACGPKTPLETVFDEIAETSSRMYHVSNFVLVIRVHGHPGYVFMARPAPPPANSSSKAPIVRWHVSDHTGQHVVNVSSEHRAGHLMLEHCDTTIQLFIDENEAQQEVQHLLETESVVQITVEEPVAAPTPSPSHMNSPDVKPVIASASMAAQADGCDESESLAGASVGSSGATDMVVATGVEVEDDLPSDGHSLTISPTCLEEMQAFSLGSATSPGVLPDLPFQGFKDDLLPIDSKHSMGVRIAIPLAFPVHPADLSKDSGRFSPTSFFSDSTAHGFHFMDLGN